jgi:signal transduction histidine kinase
MGLVAPGDPAYRRLFPKTSRRKRSLEKAADNGQHDCGGSQHDRGEKSMKRGNGQTEHTESPEERRWSEWRLRSGDTGAPSEATIPADDENGASPEHATEIDDLRERLQRAEEALREADRRDERCLTVLSQELRAPLVPLRNGLVVLSRANPTTDEGRRARAVMDRQLSHLARIVDDLLDVTRLTRGRARLRREPVHLSSLVHHAVEDHRTTFASAGIRLEGKVDGSPIWVDGDPTRLVQVIDNLLANARKFTRPGGEVVVTLAPERAQGAANERPMAVLRVRDTGVGLAPHDVERVFEPFAQAPQSIARPRGGLGLGLTMVKGLVELHGGSIRMASEGLGRGTEATIVLPLRSAQAEGATEASGSRGATASRGRRVLVIEHNVDAADTLRDVLRLGRHDVRVAYDGPAGLALAHRFRPEIVICDVSLPEMDGYDVARAFRTDPSLRGTYLVALSSQAPLEDRATAAASGFNQHLTKPPSLEALDLVLQEAPAALDIN